MRELMSHQKLALDYAEKRTRIALFMQMRLGKTLVAIRWADYNRLSTLLVVCPKSVIPPWKTELLLEQEAHEDIYVIDSSNVPPPGYRWYLINYERINYFPEVLELKWDGIILDESTRIRNPNAEITKLLNRKTWHVNHKAILSGLPNPESELDFFEQIKFLYGNFMHEHTYWHWRNKYFYQSGFEWIPVNKEKIHKHVNENAFTLTRSQAGIKTEKIIEKRYVELVPKARGIYTQILNNFEYELEKEKASTKWVLVQIGWLLMICGGFSPSEKSYIGCNKPQEILNLLKSELRNEKVVVWFRHTHELEHMHRYLVEYNIRVGKFLGYDKGGVSSEGKLNCNIQVLLAQPKCGMYGMDWSDASTSIYYSNWFDGEIREQSLDRIIHPQKKESVLIIDLITENTIEERVISLLRTKNLNSKIFTHKLLEYFKKVVLQ